MTTSIKIARYSNNGIFLHDMSLNFHVLLTWCFGIRAMPFICPWSYFGLQLHVRFMSSALQNLMCRRDIFRSSGWTMVWKTAHGSKGICWSIAGRLHPAAQQRHHTISRGWLPKFIHSRNFFLKHQVTTRLPKFCSSVSIDLLKGEYHSTSAWPPSYRLWY